MADHAPPDEVQGVNTDGTQGRRPHLVGRGVEEQVACKRCREPGALVHLLFELSRAPACIAEHQVKGASRALAIGLKRFLRAGEGDARSDTLAPDVHRLISMK